MTAQANWRPISQDEADVVRSIVSRANNSDLTALLRDLNRAKVSNSTAWILDVKTPSNTPVADVPDGPFPARAFVPTEAAYQGEVLMWLTGGLISGLEYAWITDEPPARWPRHEEMEVVALTYDSTQLPNIASYVDTIDRFITHSITAPEFENIFLRAMKTEGRVLGEPVYPILQELFEDADAYVSQPEFRTGPADLDGDQLRACAMWARTALRDIGFD